MNIISYTELSGEIQKYIKTVDATIQTAPLSARKDMNHHNIYNIKAHSLEVQQERSKERWTILKSTAQ